MTDETQAGPAGFGLPPALWQPAAAILGGGLTVIACAWALGLAQTFSLALYPQQFFAAILALGLALAFLILPARRGTKRVVVPWYDVVASVAALAATGWIAVRYPELVNLVFFRPLELTIPGLIIVALVLEGLRRATGRTLVIIVSVFLLYAMFGDLLPGRLSARAQDWERLAGSLAVDLNGILGVPLDVTATILVVFILFSQVLKASGGSQFFIDAALLLMGRFRGGSMKVAVVGSALFGSVSGSAVANVVATGAVTIPMIKRSGYPAHKAGAIEAVASTGGQLLPPVMGAAAFLMAELLEVPYTDVVIAALVPGLLYYIALLVQADLEAARLGMTAVPRSALPARRTVLGGTHFVLSFAVLIYILFVDKRQPSEAALYAAAAAAATSLTFGYAGARPRLSALVASLSETGRIVVEIILIVAAAGMVMGVMNATGLAFNLTIALVEFAGGNAILLLGLSAVVCIVLGMGLPTLGVYVLLAVLVAPALEEVGIPAIAAHLYVLYFGMMSMITPPIALAAFAAAGLAGADAMRTGLAAVRFGWTAYVIPVLFVFSPTLLLIGAPADIALAVVTACLGVWLVSAAIAGYFVARMSPATRMLFAAAGLAALIPAGAFEGALYSDIAGIGVGIAAMGFEVWRARRRPAPGIVAE